MYIKKILWAIAILGLIGMGGFAYYVYNHVFSPNTAFQNEEAHVYIPTGASFEQVIQELEPLLKDINSFALVAKRKKYDQNVKAGHFLISKGMNNNELVNAIRIGNVPITVKFNNQERLQNLAGTLSQQMETDSIALFQAMTDSVFLKQAGFNPENALAMYIPNTYEVYWNETAEAFCSRMSDAFKAFWNEDRRAKASDLGLQPWEVSVLASIVQKETSQVDERPRVAGLYLNRMRIGMLLQADPTVIYAKKKEENDFDQVIKRVLYKDLEIESPYNTYKNAGVPPGPITMPDISSIDAVLNAEKHTYLYMVVNTENLGYHKFASSISEHNRNRAAYIRWINKQGINR
ncbi:endolytic transglycosylase MltG [Aureitalea marina]|uniref:Endolytic murein transglycosylase n=1 Tax=Aureitalea marina TaxID=930804 RepID=A0A2S7KMZ9_9FLAO|nr:endolytic transglycosylase MltG [Aureitalea marina]PQB04009.1 aminodeoxychorismate lyase [Aureitalea marina]